MSWQIPPYASANPNIESVSDGLERMKQLRKAEARTQRAFARYEALRAERDALVIAALDAGWTHALISEATGLSRGRIGQIASRRH